MKRQAMYKLLPILLLAGCAPAHLTEAKQAVDKRMTYTYYTGYTKPAGLEANQGNCAAFSLSYATELREMGYRAPLPNECRLPDGAGHAVLDVDGWRLDNRYGYVMRTTESDCR